MPLKKGENAAASTVPLVSAPPPPWRNSLTKMRLRELLKDESSWVQICTAEEVWENDPKFKQYPKDRFLANFKNLKEAIELENKCIDFDEAAFKDHKHLFPRNHKTERGEPFWDAHPAKKLLEDDVSMGKVTFKVGSAVVNRKPKDVQRDRLEYQDFKLSTFRNFLHQEKRRQREEVFWQKKRNDKAAKKHQEEEKKRKEMANNKAD
jgi:hypothetical protein